VNIQTDRALIPAGAVCERYLTITVTAPTRERRTDRAAAHVSLVLDRSGSMGGRKFEMARQAVEHAIRLLDARDRLAVVCYDEEIDTLLASTPATPEAKAIALTRLRGIDARGSTDLCGGWLRGTEEVRGADAPVRRVLLLSDGLANHGETNPDALARRAADLRAQGVTTSTFGLGADFDERLMSRLATEGGGHFYFIEQAAQIPDFFASELGETLDIVARDVQVIVGGRNDIEVDCLNDFVTRIETVTPSGEGEARVCLGDLVSGHEVTVVIAVRCPARALGQAAAITVRIADRDHVFFPQPMSIEWRPVVAEENAEQPANALVLIEAARLVASRARIAALDANKRGDYDAATAALDDAVALLRGMPPGVPMVDAIVAELEAERVDVGAVMAPLAVKAVYYQSYSVAHSRTATGQARKTTTEESPSR
jgi:Ca-activated chloride channel family protein